VPINLLHPVVRDLAWVMQSPSLVSSLLPVADVVGRLQGSDLFVSDQYCNRVYDTNRQWLLELDQQPHPLIEFLSQSRSSKLGYYFENLVAWWLTQKVTEGYFESHVKVSVGNRDIGEFDFLFRSDQKYKHWETAVKFYLYTLDEKGAVTWYGPNARDTLQRKLERMLGHQIPLSGRQEASPVLADRGIDEVYSGIFMKGYLFYPLDYDTCNTVGQVAGCEISPVHLKGWWLSLDLLNEQLLGSVSGGELRWRVLPRLEWLAPRIYTDEEQVSVLSGTGELVNLLQNLFSRSDESRLIAGYLPNETGQWQEMSRGFVVGKNWPG